MPNLTSEHTFETAIEQSLITSGGYQKGDSKEYIPSLGMFKSNVLTFLQQSQSKQWERISQVHGAEVESRILQRIYKEMDLHGSLHVLRHGFTDYGVKFKMAFFKPESKLNPETIELYNKNILKVYRQVKYSEKNNNTIDMVLALNGIPVVTIELKNKFTGQSAENAKKQYNTTRDNRELLFSFKKRALVHFAVDDEEVYMTTKIEGKKTFWMPFNKGYNNGAGNPPNPNGYKTSYLWEEILTKDSLMEIIQRFINIQKEEIKIDGKVYKKEKVIFPRYHQLDVVRKITEDVKRNGVGKNYLVQHSAGSGKSNSIAWLAYRLSSLHNEKDERIFDSVIVVSDRKVLDNQLQNTIYQFEHKSGVVQKIDKNSSQLAAALSYGTSIIITTLQKFPFVIDKLGDLPKRNYAVIIDEAHSSQGGEASKKLKEPIASYSAGNNVYGESEEIDEFSGEDFIRKEIELAAALRGRPSNISFFAFTATPKYKTLALFGTKGEDGKPKPFHIYSMRQAIEEGFILDVLKNYVTYQTFFRLSKKIEDDPEVNKKQAAKAIARFVSLHPHNLTQKTEVMVEHFRQIVSKKIGGRAKAMLVTSSRLHAKRYFDEFRRYIKENGYDEEIKVLVAFSGRVVDDDFPEGVSEPQLTGFGERELPEVFNKDEYKILIVADKYQTGFDQPLLHTMYVDKKLSGVKAVQTLSRLNRVYPGKEDTFVLDFVNDRETIFKAFQPYYEVTTVTQEPDPNHLYDLKTRLDEKQIYWQSEIDSFAKVYFDPTAKLTERLQAKLYAFMDPAVDRFKQLSTEEQDEFKKMLRTWTNLYAFLAQIMPFKDIELEKFYTYAKMLLTKLPKRNLSERLKLDDEIALEYYRLQKIKEGAIELMKGEEGELDGIKEAGLKREKEEKAPLSEIIEILNERFGTEFEEADRLFFEQIEADLLADKILQKQAKVNKLDTFKYAFEDIFISKLIDRMEQNKEIFEKIIEDHEFGGIVKDVLMNSIYKKLNVTV